MNGIVQITNQKKSFESELNMEMIGGLPRELILSEDITF